MVKLLDTSRLPKPEDLQCDNLNYATHKEVSRHGVKVCVPSSGADDGGAARVSGRYPQFVHVSRVDKRLIEFSAGHVLSVTRIPGMGPLHSIHFTLVLSIPPLLSPLTSPYPSQHILSLPEENQIVVLACTTGTNACLTKLALGFWSAVTSEVSLNIYLGVKLPRAHV